MKPLLFLGVVVMGLAITTHAQIKFENGDHFTFKNGVTKWSEPYGINLKSLKGEQSIPVSIRVKYNKKLVLACHYLIEITNLSETQSVKFSVGTGYTEYNGKKVVEQFNIKPKTTKEGKLIYADGLKKPKGAEDCMNTWSPTLTFYNTKIK